MLNREKGVLFGEVLQECKEWLKKFPFDRKCSAVIEILKIVQKNNGGFLTEDLIKEVALFLDISEISVYEIATFYGMFDLQKTGRYKLCFCVSVPCMLNGSDELISYLKKKLKVDFNQTTEDGKFTLKKVECLAACEGAPVFMINENLYKNLTFEKIDSILNKLE